MNTQNRIVAAVMLMLSALLFLSSISHPLFVWFYPDEILAIMFYDDYGVFGCIKQYYNTTTINRLSASYAVCNIGWMASNVSPFWGIIIGRFIMYFMIPISLYYLLISFNNINRLLTLSIALLISSFIFFILPYAPTGTSGLAEIDGQMVMYGLDLAIYVVATFTFFLLIALFKSSLKNNYFYILFCILFAINLNSHEVFLIIGGLFIPLYYWYAYRSIFSKNKDSHIKLVNLIHVAKKEGKLLVIIFITSLMLSLNAPGLEIRLTTWPPTGNFYDGVFYIILSFVEFTFRLYNVWPLILITFVVGLLSKGYLNIRIDKFIFKFILLSVLLYIIVTSYLIGITPSLRFPAYHSLVPEWNIIFNYYDNSLSSLQGPSISQNHGGFAIRQNVFVFSTILLIVFLLGNTIKINIFQSSKMLKFGRANGYIITSIILMLFLINPERSVPVAIISNLINSDVSHSNQSDVEEKIKRNTGNLMMNYNELLLPISNYIYRRNFYIYPEGPILLIEIDRLLRSRNFNEIFSSPLLSLKHSQLMKEGKPWITKIRSLYDIEPIKESIDKLKLVECKFLDNLQNYNSNNCFNAFGSNEFSNVDLNNLFSYPLHTRTNIFKGIGVQALKFENNCVLFRNKATSTPEEHFIYMENIKVREGYNFFVIETIANNNELYIYLLNDNVGILINWLNNGDSNVIHTMTNGAMDVKFMERELFEFNKEKIKIILYSSKSQNISLRFQNGKNSNTIYKGDEKIESSICSVVQGLLIKK